MIFDHIDHRDVYAGLGSRLHRALEFLRGTDLDALEPGRYTLEGEAIYALVSEYVTKPPGEGRWEAHRRYIDVQFLVRGIERIGFAPVERLTTESYDADKDMVRLAGDGQFVTLAPGDFMILWPGDAHMPGMAVTSPAPVRKVVVKVAV